MSTIWRYVLPGVINQVSMPKGATVLTVNTKGNEVCAWVQCDPNTSLVPRTVRLYATGETLAANPGRYISTFQLGEYVFHAFEAA